MRARYAWPAVAIMVAAASLGGGAAAAVTPGHAHGPGVPRGPSRAGAAVGDSALTWYELYPSQAATPISRTVKPGDRIDAEVKLTGGKYVLTLDIGGQKPFSTTPVTAKGVQNSCVEWIAEDPNWYVGDPLSGFGSVSSSGGYATGNGKTGATGDPAWASQALTMNTGFGPVPDADPSGLSAKGTAFSVTWH
jgi:hypothetical protein